MSTPTIQNETKKLFSAGDVIMRQGDEGDCAYIILSGRVEIIVTNENGGQQHVGSRGAGAMIGEMALIDNAPRTATIKATQDCQLLEISKENFGQRIDSADPVIKMAIQVILTRYRDILKRAEIIGHPAASELDAEAIELDLARGSSAMETLRLANDFEHALENGHIYAYYQPIMDIQSGKIAGFEALMRWIDPDKGFIRPDLFIPVLEESGLIVKASQWMLKESLKALKRIENKAGFENDLFMSVNFSSHDFSEAGFTQTVYDTISTTDIKPQQLHIEITERLLIGQPDKANATLSECRQAGIGISIDDFGTGYSSLSYLHAFPIDCLKIDRSFVMMIEKDERARQLVHSIVGLGQNLGIKIIAEGIETEEESEILKSMGCEMGQGYYFCKPMPETEVILFAKEHH